MNLVFAYPDHDIQMHVKHAANGKVTRYRVTYGKDVREATEYGEAAARLGEAIMHALTCERLLE